ncbi:MAG TPA: tetratricopeptide repeat protein [Verrucomicrobiae bacterium]|nr:tetratricopeptide repeat protein [Verrucomicrobiae bacterium]
MTLAASQKWPARLICLSLAAAVLAVFWGALRCDFVNYDDPAYVTSNADVQHGLTKANVVWAFETGAASNWHPLTWLSHMADVQFYGLRPAGHHLTNLLLHAANAVLLFVIARAMTGALWRSAILAALWALHPLRVESVVWVSERKDVLSTLFWMLAVWSYFKFHTSKFKLYYAAAVVCFACGLMAKPMVVTLPFVLLLLDYWPLNRRVGWRLMIEKIPFFILAAISSVVTFLVQRQGGAVSSLTGLPLSARAGNALISYVRYLAKIFWPVHLSVLYPHPGHWPIWRIASAGLLLAIITGIVIWRGRAQPYLAVGWFWFVGMLAPAIGLVQVGIQSMADRYSYMPMIGILIMVIWGANEMLRPRWILASAAGLAILACAALTPIQVRYWRDSDTLFQHAVAVTRDNYLAYNNLGYFLSNRGETEKAMEYYTRSLQINPNYDEAHNNLGYALAQLGRFQEATNEYIKALSLNPGLTEAHNNLGNALGSLGLTDAAIHEYQVALQENPRHADAHNNYGIALAMRGQLKEAIEQFRLAVLYKENYASAHSDLGNALAMQGDFAGAIAEYQTCLRINPKDPQAHNNLANVLAQQGHLDEAVGEYRIALELKPENPEAHFNLGWCLARQGKSADAAEQYRAALRQRPDYPAARQQLEALHAAGF